MSSTPFIINAIREFIDKDIDSNKNKNNNQQNNNEQNNNHQINHEKQNLIKNTGCCGAASDAWVPSYPSSESSSLKLDEESLFSINKEDK